MDTPREFFETLESRVDPAKAAGLTASYRFEIDGGGNWMVDVDDGKVSVSESDGDADCTISTSSETFMKIANREQNPTAAYGETIGVSIFIASSTTSAWRGLTESPSPTRTRITVPGIGAVSELCSPPAWSCDASSGSGGGIGGGGERFSRNPPAQGPPGIRSGAAQSGGGGGGEEGVVGAPPRPG